VDVTPQPSETDDALADVSTLSYEQARDELVTVVGRLESGGTTLEESLALWERGEALADRCQSWLDGARDRLAQATRAREEAPEGDDAPPADRGGDEA